MAGKKNDESKPKRNPQKSASTVKEKPAKQEKQFPIDNLAKLLDFDRVILTATPLKKPAQIIIGTDEVGRGCLAGPVVACAVVLPPLVADSELGRELARLNDSKLVPADHRYILAERLRGLCQYAIGEASVEEIDEINILQASLLAMRRAVRKLKLVSPAVILIDGNKKIPSIKNIEQITVVAGDSKSASIAAASIIAKVHRDTFMKKLALKFPDYRWDSNKGYRSKDHWKALDRLGKTPWHRNSFIDHWIEEWKAGTADKDDDSIIED